MAGAAAARIAKAPERALGQRSIPPAPGSPASGREPLRSQLARAPRLQRARLVEYARRIAMTPGNDLSPRLRRRHVYAAKTAAYQALSAYDFR